MLEKKKILLIDDEEDYCYFLSRNLEASQEFEVTVATNGRAGIALALEKQPDLILLDIVLPGLSGADVANQLTRDPQTRRIPIIFITAIVTHRELGDKALCQISGNSFISKTAETSEIILAINKMLHL